MAASACSTVTPSGTRSTGHVVDVVVLPDADARAQCEVQTARLPRLDGDRRREPESCLVDGGPPRDDRLLQELFTRRTRTGVRDEISFVASPRFSRSRRHLPLRSACARHTRYDDSRACDRKPRVLVTFERHAIDARHGTRSAAGRSPAPTRRRHLQATSTMRTGTCLISILLVLACAGAPANGS